MKLLNNSNSNFVTIGLNSITDIDLKFLMYLNLNEILYPLLIDIINLYKSVDISKFDTFFAHCNDESVLLNDEEFDLFESVADTYPNIDNTGVVIVFRGLFVLYLLVLKNFELNSQDKEFKKKFYSDDTEHQFRTLMTRETRPESCLQLFKDIIEKTSFNDGLKQLIFDYFKIFQIKFDKYPAVFDNPFFQRGAILADFDLFTTTIRNYKVPTDIWTNNDDVSIYSLCLIRDKLMILFWNDLIESSYITEERKKYFNSITPNLSDSDIVELTKKNGKMFLGDYIITDILLSFKEIKQFNNQTLQIMIAVFSMVQSKQYIYCENLFFLMLTILLSPNCINHIKDSASSGKFSTADKYQERITILVSIFSSIIKMYLSETRTIEDLYHDSEYPYFKNLIDAYKIYMQML